MSLAESLERAAEALGADADGIRPANGDPDQLLALLDALAAGRVLGWLLAHEPDAAAELAQAWLERPAGVEALGRVSEAGLPKAGRKALRRALHHARSRGLAVQAETAEPEAKVARLPKLEEEIGAAYVSPYDPRGGRLVYVVESDPAGGARVFEALIDEQRGVVDFQVYRAGRRQVRDFVRDVTRRGRFTAVPAEPDEVRALIARRAAAQPAQRPWPRAGGAGRGRLSGADSAGPTPGERALASLGEGASEAALGALVECVEAREIGPWPPPPEALDGAIVKLREQAEALRESGGGDDLGPLEQAADEALTPLVAEGETALANAERLQETAYVYWRGGKEDLARACLATAHVLREGDAEEKSASGVVRALVGVLSKALIEDLRVSVFGAQAGTATTSHAPQET